MKQLDSYPFKKIVTGYVLACLLPYIILGIGVLLYGWHGYSDHGWDILFYAVIAAGLFIFNTIAGFFITSVSLHKKKLLPVTILSFLIGGPGPIILWIILAMNR